MFFKKGKFSKTFISKYLSLQALGYTVGNIVGQPLQLLRTGKGRFCVANTGQFGGRDIALNARVGGDK